jgi:hypothetical protein
MNSEPRCSHKRLEPGRPKLKRGIEIPTPAAVAWRKAETEECSRHADIKLANPHVPKPAAARAMHALAPEMTFDEACWLAHKATAWAAQAHHKWLWRDIPGNAYGL